MGMDTKNEDTDSGGSRDRARLERSSEATTSGEEQILSNGNGNGDADQGGRSTETHWRKIRTSFAEESETSPAGVGGGGGGGGTSSSGGATRKGGGMKQVISNVMHKAANSHLNILRRSQADLELYDCGPTMVRISAPAHTQWALHSLPDRFSIYVHAARIDLLSRTHFDVMLVKCLVSPSLSLCMYLSASCSPSVRQCAAHTRAGVSASGTKRVARQESIAGACICSRQRHVHDFKEFRAFRTTCGEMQLCLSELLTTIHAPQPLFACVHIYIYICMRFPCATRTFTHPTQDAITVPLQDDERDASMRNTFFSTPSRTRVDTYDLPPPSSDARFSLPTLAEAREELEKARVHFLTVLSSLHIECGFGGDLPRSDSN